MAISVSCGKCDKRYSVKDELAGKKFRCKECETLVAVPAPHDDDDPFSGLTMKSSGRAIDDDEEEEEEEYDESPRSRSRRPARKEKSKPRRVSRSRDEMSMGVKFAIGAIVGLRCFNFLSLLGLMMISAMLMIQNQQNRDLVQILGTMIIMAPVIIRIFIEYRVIWGLRQKQSQTRLTATIMAVLMTLIIGAFVCLLASTPLLPQQPAGAAQFMIALLSFQLLCELVVIIGLNLPASSEFLSD